MSVTTTTTGSSGSPPGGRPSWQRVSMWERITDRFHSRSGRGNPPNDGSRPVKWLVAAAIILALAIIVSMNTNWSLGWVPVLFLLFAGGSGIALLVGVIGAAMRKLFAWQASQISVVTSLIALLLAVGYMMFAGTNAASDAQRVLGQVPTPTFSSAPPSTTPAPAAPSTAPAKPAPSSSAAPAKPKAQAQPRTAAGSSKGAYVGGYFPAYDAPAGTNDFGPAFKDHSLSAMAKRANFLFQNVSLWAATKVWMHDNHVSDPRQVNTAQVHTLAVVYENNPAKWKSDVQRVWGDVKSIKSVYRSGGYSTLGMVTKADGSMPSLIKSHKTADQGWTLVTTYKNGVVLEQRINCDFQFSRPDSQPTVKPAAAKPKPAAATVQAPPKPVKDEVPTAPPAPHKRHAPAASHSDHSDHPSASDSVDHDHSKQDGGEEADNTFGGTSEDEST